MHVLFVHPNFPAQFRYLAPRLARDVGWRCTFVTRNATAPDLPGVQRVFYHRRGGASAANHPCTRYFERAVRDAHGVYEALKERPDLPCGRLRVSASADLLARAQAHAVLFHKTTIAPPLSTSLRASRTQSGFCGGAAAGSAGRGGVPSSLLRR